MSNALKVMDNFCNIWLLLNNNVDAIHAGLYHEWDINVFNTDPFECYLVFYDSQYDIVGEYPMKYAAEILAAKFPDVFDAS